MRNIDTSSWKEFRLEDLFEKVKTEKIIGKANDFPTVPVDEYIIPLLTAGADNQGLARYAKKEQCSTILKNVITISANGANTGITFYQKDEFAVLQDAYAIKLKNIEIPDEQTGLFLATCISKLLHGNFSWSYKAGWERIKSLFIKLPVTESEEIDWDYMQERITELEQERITELEQERITELEQYLIVTGLNDYELTDEDRKVLSLSGFRDNKESDSEDTVRVCKEMREFRCGDLFDVHPTKAYKMSNDELYQTNGNLPILSNSSVNNGIGGYCGLDTTESGGIITFSDTTTGTDTMFYQPNPFIGYSHVQGMYPYDEHWNECQQRYFISAMKHVCGNGWSYSNKFNRKLVVEMTPLLPIQTDIDGNPVIDADCKYHPDGYIPDWEFMEKYIRAIEKIVIKDVVKYKDEVIAKTRDIVA